MSAIVEQTLHIAGGGILYDASLLRKPEPSWFEREYWAQRNALREVAGGRGSVCFLQTDVGSWVLRHYRRGGLIARISADRYLWSGQRRTRSFAEWRLLAQLRRLELPVPAPIAAAYFKHGLTYRADLITAELPVSRTLAVALAESLSDGQWQTIGATIARFHSHGVCHADLNAHNILLGSTGPVYVLDFDRGRIRPRGAWEQMVLARLRRSLDKIAGRHSAAVFSEREWTWLMQGYGRNE
ncbi:MAG TPA: 3-deoxy-D-manno-octulosonic acid kinase [Povalibacter sp.]